VTTDPYGDAGPATFGPGGQAPAAPGYGISDPAPATYGDDAGATAAGTGAGSGSGTGSGGTKETAKAEAGQVKDTAAGAAQQVAGTAKDEASNVVGEAKAQASNLLDQVRGEAGSQVGTQKDRLASMAHSYAKELGAMASGSQESGPVTDFVQDLSRRVGGAGHWLENHEPADVLDEVRRFARRRPGAFLLTALAAGVVVGRLTRGAVDEHRAQDDTGAGTATPELTTDVAAPSGYVAPTYAEPVGTYPSDQTYPGGQTYPGAQGGYADTPATGYPETGALDDPYRTQGATYGTNPGDVR
jgi:uncharacterized protein YjbJ (UPF0337 family)